MKHNTGITALPDQDTFADLINGWPRLVVAMGRGKEENGKDGPGDYSRKIESYIKQVWLAIKEDKVEEVAMLSYHIGGLVTEFRAKHKYEKNALEGLKAIVDKEARLNARWGDSRKERELRVLSFIRLRVENDDVEGKTHADLLRDALAEDERIYRPKLEKYRPLGRDTMNRAVKKMLRDEFNRPDLIKGGDGKPKKG